VQETRGSRLRFILVCERLEYVSIVNSLVTPYHARRDATVLRLRRLSIHIHWQRISASMCIVSVKIIYIPNIHPSVIEASRQFRGESTCECTMRIMCLDKTVAHFSSGRNSMITVSRHRLRGTQRLTKKRTLGKLME
jgi:hypothetical protein